MSWVTIANVESDVLFKVNKTSTDISASDLLRMENKVLREIYAGLIGQGEDWYAEIATFNIVANQREYTLPADSSSTPWGGGVIKVLRLELKLDGNNWTIANQTKLAEGDIPYNETDIATQYNNGSPFYAVYDKSMFILSGTISSVTTGGRIMYIKRPAEVTATSDVPNLPNEFLTLLSIGISRDIYEKYGQIDKYNIANAQFERIMSRLLDNQDSRVQNSKTVLLSSNENYS